MSSSIGVLAMKIVIIGNNKGGIGKTFLTMTLGIYAARKGLRTWLIDLDPQCNLSRRFLDMRLSNDGQFDYEAPIHPDYETGDEDWNGYSDSADIWLSEGIVPYPTRYKNLSILPGNGKKLAEIELVRRADMHKKVVNHLTNFLRSPDVYFDEFDLCLIDTRPSKGPLVQAAFHAADKVVIPTEFAAPSVEGLHGMLALQRTVNMDREVQEPELEIAAIVGNKVKTGTSLQKEFRKKLESEPLINQYLMPESFSDWQDYMASMVFGADSIFDVGQTKTIEQASQVCEELLKRIMK
jgi:chromosome partitioning protein